MPWNTDEPRFKVGDIVKLRGCSGKQRVTHVDAHNDTISTKYLRSTNNYYDRRAIDFELVEQPKPRFNVGDIVRLRGNKGHQRVTKVNTRNDTISTKYLKSDNFYYDRRAIDFELVEQPKPRKAQKEILMAQLFKVTKTGAFGEFVTEDADKRYVLKMSEGGYNDFDPKELEKVCPYTVQIDFAAGGGGHFKVPKDSGLEEDDVVLIGRNFGMVKKIDTQRDNAQDPINLRRIVTEPVGAAAVVA